MKNISDVQQALVIKTVASIPCEPARKPFLVALENLLPHKGRLNDQQFIDAINSALASFRPGQWHGDAQGLIPPITASTTLKEASEIYMRTLREVGAWCWPPLRPLTEEEKKKKPTDEECGEYKRELKYPVEWHEPVKSKPITQKELGDPEPVEPAPFVNYLGAVSLDKSEYSESVPAAKAERIDQDDELRPGYAFEQGDDDEDGGMSEMAKAARLAKKSTRNRNANWLGGRNPVKVFFK